MSGVADAESRKRTRPVSNDRNLYPRKRAVQACRTCRRRRTKCDNEQPACTSCINLDIPCIYEEKDKSTFDAASLAILQRLDGLEDLIRSSASGNTGGQARPTDHVSSFTSPKQPGSPALESPALERPDASALCHINIETVLCWPIFGDLNLDRRLDLRYLLQSRNPDSEPPPISITLDFENVGAPKLLQRFFEEVHIYNPVLEVETVEEYVRYARFNGLGWDAPSCLLLLAYALGSIYAIQKSSESIPPSDIRHSVAYREADGFFFAAQKRMGVLLCRSGLVEAQCFFLAGVYLMATMRPIEAWKMFVQALACCQGFPMQRVAGDEQSEEVTQLQESIYWTCFKSELELRLELNVANNSVWDLTYPSFFPSPPKGLKSQNEAVWYFYLAEIALRRLGNRILNYIYQYQSSETSTVSLDDAVSNFEHQAEGWLASLPPALSLENADGNMIAPQDTNDEHTALRFILSGHLIDCYEMMYWPFVVAAIHGTLPSDTNSQSFAKKGIDMCIQRIDKNENGFCKRHHGTWLMIRSCTRSALVLVAASRAGLTTLLTSGWEISVSKVIDMLRYWKGEAQDVPDRLDILENLMK
ncbi:hypothetical protein BKA61DRAFT_739337 [Leptodontidium sp. MPI-SDFR-AT-0119]|nr:hypothetical protein BKA61DRAFT_739337 [Leptodontidium sp. MPI-SDFR-AT-0119]